MRITSIAREDGKVIQVGIDDIISDDVDENTTVYFDRVVRCRNCQHYCDGICSIHRFCLVHMNPWDYCSYGELKEN